MASQQPSNVVQLLSPDSRVYSVPADQADAYKERGWISPAAEPDEQEVHNTFSDWQQQGRGEAAFWSATHGILGFASAVEAGTHAIGRDDWGRQYAQRLAEAEQQYPNQDMAARLVTGVGSAGLYAAGAAAAAPLVAGAAGAIGLGGEVAAGAAGLAGATGVAEGAIAAGEVAAAGGEALGLGAQALQAAPTIAKVGATLAAENAAYGVIDRYDQAALEHAITPQGREKIVWSMSDISRDAALGVGAGFAFKGVAKGIAGLGKKLEGRSLGKLTDALLDAKSVEQAALNGRDGELRKMAQEVVPLGLERARTYAANVVDKAEKDMNQLKFEIDGSYLDKANLADLREKVGTMLGGSKEGSDILRMIDSTHPEKLDVQRLQDIRRASYDMINFAGYLDRPINAQIKEVGEVFGSKIRGVFDQADASLGKQYSQRWKQLDESYSAGQLLQAGLRKGNDVLKFGALVSKITRAAATAGALGSLGFMGGAVPAAKASAGFATLQNIKAEHFAEAGQALGKVMQKADLTLSTSIMRGLRGAPSIVANQFSPAKYQEAAAKLSAIGADPPKAATNINQNLLQAGVPEDMAQDMTGALHAQNMYMVDQLKTVTGPADMPSLGHGDPIKQRKIMGQLQTMQDPTHGIDNPTQANLEVLKKHYPETLLAAQTAIYQQLRRNPKLSPKAKLWASRVLGRPINNLSSPKFSAILSQARTVSAQQAQQAGKPSGSSRKSDAASEDTGEQTRLDELQGGN